MGSHFTKVKLEIVQYIWNCTDLIHEFMDYLYLQDISSISRIHRASSNVIYSYRFKSHHCCNYDWFVYRISRYNKQYKDMLELDEIYKAVISRPNYYDKLTAMKFHSIIIKSSLNYAPHLYSYQCLQTCSSLAVANTNILDEIMCSLKPGTVLAVTKLMIMSSVDSLPLLKLRSPLEGADQVFINLEELHLTIPLHFVFPLLSLPIRILSVDGIGSFVSCLPKTLERLTIEEIFAIKDNVDLSHLIHLQYLEIDRAGENIKNIVLPSNLTDLTIPTDILVNGQKFPKNLVKLSSEYSGNRIITPSGLNPAFIKDTNIKELNLYGPTSAWWKIFDPPSSLKVIGCDYDKISDICKYISFLDHIILQISSGTYISAWICDKTINPCQIYNNTKIELSQWFKLTKEEFRTIENKLATRRWINVMEKYKIKI